MRELVQSVTSSGRTVLAGGVLRVAADAGAAVLPCPVIPYAEECDDAFVPARDAAAARGCDVAACAGPVATRARARRPATADAATKREICALLPCGELLSFLLRSICVASTRQGRDGIDRPLIGVQPERYYHGSYCQDQAMTTRYAAVRCSDGGGNVYYALSSPASPERLT